MNSTYYRGYMIEPHVTGCCVQVLGIDFIRLNSLDDAKTYIDNLINNQIEENVYESRFEN